MEKSQINSYIEQNKDRMLNELLDLLKIPSISADSKHKDSVLKTAEAVKQRLIEAGADKVEVSPSQGYPVVYGEKNRVSLTWRNLNFIRDTLLFMEKKLLIQKNLP